MTPETLKDKIINIFQEKKANDITVISVAEQTTVADYFIIVTAGSTAQAKALAEKLEQDLEKQQIFALRKDGLREARWIVVDYGSILVHIFNDETRDFYNLEKLWVKGENIQKLD